MNNNSYMDRAKRVAMAVVLGAGFNMMLVSASSAGLNAGPWTRSSTVTDTVADNNNGTWRYGYTVNNTSQFDPIGTDFREPIIVDWELPWFNDAGITNIVSPTNWAWAIETIGVANFATGWGGVAAWQDPSDLFYEGATSPYTTATEVLHWYNLCWLEGRNEAATDGDPPVQQAVSSCDGPFDNAAFLGDSLAGFGFDAAFDQTAAPYQASWSFLPIRTGDPAFPLGGPASPQALGQAVAVPEPGALALFGAAMMALVWSRRRRQA